MKTLTKSNKKEPLICILLFQIGLLSTYSHNLSLSDFTSPEEITSNNKTTSSDATRNMIVLHGFNIDGKNELENRRKKLAKK